MSESRPRPPETESPPERTPQSTGPERREDLERRTEKFESAKNIERQARRELEGLSNRSEQREPLELLSDDDPVHEVRITPDDKRRAYRHALKHLQRKLNGPSRGFSRLIHSPAAERTSEALEKTVARPSAILGGGLAATAGLAIMTYFARRHGFALSGSELILFLAAGWLAGLLVELVWKKLIKR